MDKKQNQGSSSKSQSGGGGSDSTSQKQSQPQSQSQAQSPPKGGSRGGSSGASEGSSSDQQGDGLQPAGSGGGGGGDGGDYMGIVGKWRSAMGLSSLSRDSKLQSNAQDTSSSSGGALKHKLNSGSMAQVMAPGNSGNFESVFVGGWLCEMPNLPGLGSSVCSSMTKGWNHAGQTGHAEILSSTKYKKIGCALAGGIWTCDLA
ncbi:uncharacterized protein HMPREF1541_06219 [Cyphellophora europaea CBS 101466]|uniref:SCP domain-containing protein n=1 Tax=Cyphellophora europaea (strain CBS 101466) TaxID=1220924 RepID=W2RR41_CYPE1|nr:uncharacterized protein HMPREF1541_06219 [Cyphellophora europaea CBS 101466]ETN38188.1 hypothetical protein HMPREF1541_06219 [Cyphellophora europaea CBS 101466]